MKSSNEKIYEFIVEYMLKHNYPPSIRDICAGVGLSSSSTVYSHLITLQGKGLIDMKEKSSRAITVKGIHYIDQRNKT